MSECHQSGLHPDADQLNAFVEHALPPHEREQTLSHLAGCPACRRIVSLSLPPAAEIEHPQVEPVRRPWSFGWNLAWPIAAAFAALVPAVLYVHKTETSHNKLAQPPEIAAAHPPAPPPAPPAAAPLPPAKALAPPAAAPPPRAAEKSAPTPTAAAKSASAGMPQPRAPINSADATLGGTIENQLYSQLPLSMNGGPRDAKAFQSFTPGARDKPAGAAGAGRNNGSSGIYGGTGQANLNENYVEGVPVASAPASRPPQAVPAPASPATAASAVDQTVAVSDAQAELETGGASLGALTLRVTVPRAPLPSGLPTLSIASSGRLVLALDTSNVLFVSDDGGRRWKPVSMQWKGRAVNVALTNPPAAQLHGALVRSGAGLSGFAAGQLAATPRQGPGVSGTVTDPAGAVIPDASIVITDAAKQVFRNGRTDSAGRYRIDGLAPGNYQLEARAPGFQVLTQPVTVASAQGPANLTLQVGSATQTVTVTAAPAMALEDTSSAESTDAIKVTPPAVQAPPAPLFEITTESGDRWISPDGQTWTRRP